MFLEVGYNYRIQTTFLSGQFMFCLFLNLGTKEIKKFFFTKDSLMKIDYIKTFFNTKVFRFFTNDFLLKEFFVEGCGKLLTVF